MTLLAAFAPTQDDHASLALAAQLARSDGEDVHMLAVVPSWWPTPLAGGVDREYAAWSRHRGSEAVAEAEALVAEMCPDVAVTASWIAERSIAKALLAKALEIDARMIVLGSGHEGSHGSVRIGSIADVLLHSSPVPVAVAPRGCVAGAGATVSRVTCGFRGDEASRRTLLATAEICARVGASLRVATFAVRGRTMYPPETGIHAEDMIAAAWAEQATQAQAEAIAALPADLGLDVESAVVSGRSWAAAVDRLEWERDEVLVLGSSRVGLAARLFLGSHAARILRVSPVPVILVP